MSSKRLALAAGVVLVAGLVIALLVARKKRRGSIADQKEAAVVKGVNYAMAPFMAMRSAPEGKTNCETAYNAFEAFDKKSNSINRAPPWVAFPKRSTFLDRCNALPAQTQQCLVPQYGDKHHDVCDKLLEPLWASGKLLEMKPHNH